MFISFLVCALCERTYEKRLTIVVPLCRRQNARFDATAWVARNKEMQQATILSARLARWPARHRRAALRRRFEAACLAVRLTRLAGIGLALLRHAILLHTITGWKPDLRHPRRAMRGESKSRGRLRCPRPVYRMENLLAWRHTDSGHDHTHRADANHRNRPIGHDHHVAQVDHRHRLPITTLEYFQVVQIISRPIGECQPLSLRHLAESFVLLALAAAQKRI